MKLQIFKNRVRVTKPQHKRESLGQVELEASATTADGSSSRQQLMAAAHGNRSRQQMATTHSTDRGSRWQQIVAQIAASDRSNRSHVGCRFRRQIWFRQSQTSSLWFPQHSQQIGSVLCVVCVFHSVWFCVIHSVWFCVNCCEYLWVVRFELWGFALCRLHLVCSVRVYCVMCKL